MNWEAVLPLFIFIAIIFMIGIWAGKFVSRSDSFLQEYFLGGRSLGGFILAMTLVTTYGSASSFLSGPGTAYNEGLGWVLLSMTQLATGYFVLMVLGKRFAIVTRKYKAVTIVDFLKERYQSKWVVILSAASILIFLFSAMSAQWIGGARLVQSLTGIPYFTALCIFSIAVLVYVVVGGFRAVAITDGIQGIIMFIGTLILLIAVIIAGGGVSQIMHDLSVENPNLITPFGADGSLTPAYVSSFWILVGVGVVALPQIAVRAMSYKNTKALHRGIIISTFVVGFIMLNMHLIGVFGRTVLPGIEIGDTVMPELAQAVLPGWVAGIVLAAPMAAIMTTVNSLLLMVSSTIVKDVYLNYIRPDANDKTIRKWSMGATALIGIIVVLMSLQPPDLIIWLNLFSMGGLEAAFIWPIILGLYWRRGTKHGAIASMLTGVLSYIIFETFYPQPFGMHSVVTSMLLALTAFVSGSLLYEKEAISS
ncbi:sodium/pantothenate symporter [Oceanobacillus oncorhynchi]|uniref:Sodium/pantothenate symporter n=1 Tax=Oceanobacillus oncorhynchi TaxID=545501 RepID=A0A0A1MTX6_9BACI|nr:sodium/pantothenate symporter [Oceanobacillus oncorhynchi]CEI82371.1 Sodium/pantothenate symporter [Oceanobacillus oncorhynchi]